MTIQEYNRRRYNHDYRKSFLTSVKSYARTLAALGCTVTFPDDEEFQRAVDVYIENRPRRSRADWGKDE